MHLSEFEQYWGVKPCITNDQKLRTL